MGPRMPCAQSGSDDSINRNIATMIALQRTAFSSSFYFLLLPLPSRFFRGGSFRARRRSRVCATLCAHRQSTLGDQAHCLVDRDMSDACLLIYPAVAVELLLLIQHKSTQLAPLVDLEQRRVVFLELVPDVVPVHAP